MSLIAGTDLSRCSNNTKKGAILVRKIFKDNVVFCILCLLFIYALFLRGSTAVIVEDLKLSFGIPSTSLGLMVSAFFYAYGAAQIPVGLLSDKIGVPLTVTTFGLLTVAGTALFAYSTGVQMATWARVLTGIGTAGVWVPSLKHLATAYAPERFATLTSIIYAVGCNGFMIATYPLAVLVEKVGWRFSYKLTSLTLLLLVLLAYHLLTGTNTGRTGTDGEKNDPATDERDKNKGGSNITEIPFWRHRAFWIFSLWAFIAYGIYSSFLTLWGGAYLNDIYLLSRNATGSHLMFSSFGTISGGLIWGIISERYCRARRPVLFWGTFGLFISLAALFLFPSYPGAVVTSIIYFFLGFFGIVFLIDLSCVKEFFPVEISGAALGTVNALMFAGVAFYQGFTGYILDMLTPLKTILFAYRAVCLIYLASLILALILVALMPETYYSGGPDSILSHSSSN